MNTSDPYYSIVAMSHGLIGLFIFATGLAQFFLKKYGILHKIIGYSHLLAWIGILLTGAYIGSPVIVAIVVLGFYLCVTGVRAAIRKEREFELMDKLIIGAALLVILFLLYASIALIINQNWTFAIICGFFCLLYSFIVGRDFLHYILHKNIFKEIYGPMTWYVNHMTRMLFSFLTAIGAFAAVQHVFNNTVLDFILPAVIGFFIVRIAIKIFIKKANLKTYE